MLFHRILTMVLATSVAVLSAPALAQDPHEVVLRVDGATKGGAVFEFTLAQLDAMPQAIIKTSTPWHDGVVEFQGVSLAQLAAHVGASGDVAYVTALNDYAAELPASDFIEFGPILAHMQDGALMPVRDKGPLFVVYPYDDNPALQSETYYTRSVWQVKQITVE
jgi:hypothetical protein